MSFCRECGNKIQENINICSQCGAKQIIVDFSNNKIKSRLVTLIWWLFIWLLMIVVSDIIGNLFDNEFNFDDIMRINTFELVPMALYATIIVLLMKKNKILPGV